MKRLTIFLVAMTLLTITACSSAGGRPYESNLSPGTTLQIKPLEHNIRQTPGTKTQNPKLIPSSALMRIFPNRIGVEWIYNGFAEYGHRMKLDSINTRNDGTLEYAISGNVADMSGGAGKGDFSVRIRYLISDKVVREIIDRGEKLPHKIKEFDILRLPLNKGNQWKQMVSINGKKTQLTARIVEESVEQTTGKREFKVEYTARVEGMPNNQYREVRVFKEGMGVTYFENTFDKDILFNYSLVRLQ